MSGSGVATTTPRVPGPQGLAGIHTAVIVGFARTGRAVARALAGSGVVLTALDDAPSPAAIEDARTLGVALTRTEDMHLLAELVGGADLVVASPGVAPTHPALRAASPDRLVSEVELAWRLCPVPIVAVTGTNGKTSVTALVAAMLVRSGRRAPAAGNIGRPLIEAVREPGIDAVVAEVSSFQLAHTHDFRPAVATYLNFAPDHLDWHRDVAAYAAAKARLFRSQRSEDRAIANAEDPVTLAAARAGKARLSTFGRGEGDYHLAGETLVGPGGLALATAADLPRALPHDLVNALAAFATALDAGADPRAARTALGETAVLPHRVELVALARGVSWYDDSKATTPAAVAAALAGFERVVLLAGGRNKGLDLSVLRDAAEQGGRRRVRAVVALGEARDAVAAAFAGYRVEAASSMAEAVALADALAEPGDAVLLSPGCASFDWYGSYEERGEDFARLVRARAGRTEVDAGP